MQDGFDDSKEEQQSREDETEESTERKLVEDMMLDGQSTKNGGSEMEDSETSSKNKMDGEEISDDKYMIKDSGQDGKNSEVMTSNCVVAQTLRLQECLLYFIWEDQDETVLYLPYNVKCAA